MSVHFPSYCCLDSKHTRAGRVDNMEGTDSNKDGGQCGQWAHSNMGKSWSVSVLTVCGCQGEIVRAAADQL